MIKVISGSTLKEMFNDCSKVVHLIVWRKDNYTYHEYFKIILKILFTLPSFLNKPYNNFIKLWEDLRDS